MSSQKGELNDKLKGQQNKVKKLVSCFVRRHNTTSAKESTIGIFVNVVWGAFSKSERDVGGICCGKF